MSPWTKAPWFKTQAEGQGFPRLATVHGQYPFSEQKPREANVTAKEADPTHSQILCFRAAILYCFYQYKIFRKSFRDIPLVPYKYFGQGLSLSFHITDSCSAPLYRHMDRFLPPCPGPRHSYLLGLKYSSPGTQQQWIPISPNSPLKQPVRETDSFGASMHRHDLHTAPTTLHRDDSFYLFPPLRPCKGAYLSIFITISEITINIRQEVLWNKEMNTWFK